MRKQVILIRGGEVKENFEDFYDYLNKIEYNPYEEKTKRWYKSFDKFLGDNFEGITIPTPNNDFADYNAWKIMFEKVIPYLKDDFVLIGHSLGGTFLVKYLDEDDKFDLKEKASKIILVAPAYEDIEGDLIGSFDFNKSLTNLKNFQNKIFMFGSKDDFVVPFYHFEKFKEILPEIKFLVFEDKGHFLQEDFPELIDILNNK